MRRLEHSSLDENIWIGSGTPPIVQATGEKTMKLNMERMEWGVWLLVIVPGFAIAGYLLGVEESLLLLLLLPFVIMIKNTFLEEKLAWRDEYSVGVESFDNDHKKLLELILRMFRVWQRQGEKNQQEAAKAIAELLEYTESHFGREEGVMKKHAFPGLEAHCKEHEEMKDKVKEFQVKFTQDSSETSQDVLRYLQYWLINHINNTDKEYTEFLNDKGVR